MQSSGRVLVSSARTSLLRASRNTSIRPLHPSPPTILATPTVIQRRGYRRTPPLLKDDDDKKHKSSKDVEKPSEEDPDKKIDTPADEQGAKAVDKAAESSKESKTGEPESTGKERRSRREKQTEESIRPGIITRNSPLSLVANSGSKSRVDIPETYPQCMALAMSGRPILPGFYSKSLAF